jgi:hypothetical protein
MRTLTTKAARPANLVPRTPNREPSQVEVFRNMIAQHALGLGRPNYSPPRS